MQLTIKIVEFSPLCSRLTIVLINNVVPGSATRQIEHDAKHVFRVVYHAVPHAAVLRLLARFHRIVHPLQNVGGAEDVITERHIVSVQLCEQ